MELAEEIRKYLKKKKISQKEFARKADIREGYLCDVLHGKIKHPGVSTRRKIEDAMKGKTYSDFCNPPEDCFKCKFPDCIRKDVSTPGETKILKAALKASSINSGYIRSGRLSSGLRSGWM